MDFSDSLTGNTYACQNAVKLERMFAAPFIAQLGRGHVEGVYSLAKDPESLEVTTIDFFSDNTRLIAGRDLRLQVVTEC